MNNFLSTMSHCTLSSATRPHDQHLIAQIVAGNQNACAELVKRYERLMRFVAGRYLNDPEAVSEVVQDAFMRAFRALPHFRGDAKLGAWLCKIVSTSAVSRLRTRRYAAWSDLAGHVMEKACGDDVSEAFERAEMQALVRSAIHRLSPNDALTIELFYLREYSIQEICMATGWSVATIKSRLWRARQRLRADLEERLDIRA